MPFRRRRSSRGRRGRSRRRMGRRRSLVSRRRRAKPMRVGFRM